MLMLNRLRDEIDACARGLRGGPWVAAERCILVIDGKDEVYGSFLEAYEKRKGIAGHGPRVGVLHFPISEARKLLAQAQPQAVATLDGVRAGPGEVLVLAFAGRGVFITKRPLPSEAGQT